jgi:hypothetical protein
VLVVGVAGCLWDWPAAQYEKGPLDAEVVNARVADYRNVSFDVLVRNAGNQTIEAMVYMQMDSVFLDAKKAATTPPYYGPTFTITNRSKNFGCCTLMERDTMVANGSRTFHVDAYFQDPNMTADIVYSVNLGARAHNQTHFWHWSYRVPCFDTQGRPAPIQHHDCGGSWLLQEVEPYTKGPLQY